MRPNGSAAAAILRQSASLATSPWTSDGLGAEGAGQPGGLLGVVVAVGIVDDHRARALGGDLEGDGPAQARWKRPVTDDDEILVLPAMTLLPLRC